MAGELNINWGLLGNGPDLAGAAQAVLQKRTANLQAESARQQIDLATKQNARQELADKRDADFRSQVTAAIDPTTGQIDPIKAHQAYLSVGDLSGAVAFDKNAREAAKAKLDEGLGKINATSQIFGGVVDQPTLDAAKAKATALGLDTSDVPQTYDPNAIHAIQVQGLDAAKQLTAAHQAFTEKLDAAKAAEDARHNKAAEANSAGQLGVAQGQLGVAQANLGVNQGRLAVEKQKAAGALLDPQAVTAMASQALAGDKTVFSGLGRSPQNQALVRAEIVKQGRDQGLTPAQIGKFLASANSAYVGQTAAARTTGNMGAKIDFGVNELQAAIPLAAAASAAVPRGSFVPLTKVQQLIARGNSDPKLKDFAVKTQAAINAYNLTAARAGSSVTEREHNTSLLTTAESPEAFQAALSAMMQEAQTAKGASKQTMSEVTGQGGSTPPPTKIIKYDRNGRLAQ